MAVIYSFDVFDTALVRRVALPADVFRLTARRLAPAPDPRALSDFEEAFVSARILAENNARARAAPQEDCSLTAIWDELRALLPDLPAAAGPHSEEAAERETIVANPHLAGHINALQDAGERVIFVSDIFHSRAFVFELLHATGLARDIAQVHVSSEAGLLKASGRLFAHVAALEGVAVGDLVHTGDNGWSDVRAARRAGVRASLYPQTRLNGAEQAVLAAARDGLTGSRLAAAMRLARLAAAPDGRAGVVPALLGPIAALFAAWSLRHARDRGIDRVYFVARDGYVPWRAAARFATAFPGIDSRYVRLSRHSLVAAVPRLGDFGVFWIDRSWRGKSVAEIAALVGYEWHEIEAGLRDALPHAARDYLLTGTDEMRRFVEVLDTAPTPAGSVRLRDRQAAIAFLRSQGMFDDTRYLIVDVGWYLNLQAALKALIDQQGGTGFAGGLYFGLSNGRVPEVLAGAARGLFHEHPHAPDLPHGANTVFERRILVEHLMGLAPHGSAKGYDEIDGVATVREGPIDATRIATVQRIADDIADFADLVAPFAADLGDEGEARRIAAAPIDHVLAEPGSYDLTTLAPLRVEADSGRDEAMSIVQPWRPRSVAQQLVPFRLRERLGLSHGPTLWPEASLARSGAASNAALGFIRRGRSLAGRLLRRGR